MPAGARSYAVVAASFRLRGSAGLTLARASPAIRRSCLHSRSGTRSRPPGNRRPRPLCPARWATQARATSTAKAGRSPRALPGTKSQRERRRLVVCSPQAGPSASAGAANPVSPRRRFLGPETLLGTAGTPDLRRRPTAARLHPLDKRSCSARTCTSDMRLIYCPKCDGTGSIICSACDGEGCTACPGRCGRFHCDECVDGCVEVRVQEEPSEYGRHLDKLYRRRVADIYVQDLQVSTWIGELTMSEAIAALYNAASSFGIGFHDPDYGAVATSENAAAWIIAERYLDYVNGRLMKIRIVSEERIDTRRYDSVYGAGTARMVLSAARRGGVCAPEILEHHRRLSDRNLISLLE